MTVIVFDGRYLAADGRITSNTDIDTDSQNKIWDLRGCNSSYKGEKILYMAGAGEWGSLQSMAEAIASGEDFGHNHNAMIITTKSVYLYIPDAVHWPRLSNGAIGSGGDYARSALHLGMSAKQAAKHAAKLCATCGGKVRVLDLYKVWGRK